MRLSEIQICKTPTKKRQLESIFEVPIDDEDSSSEYSNDSDRDFLIYDEEDYDEEFPILSNPKWKKVTKYEAEEWLEGYHAKAGPQNCPFTHYSKPIDFFHLIFTKELLNDILSWTNARATERIDNEKRRKNKMKLWFNMEEKELKAFLGVLLTMGIVRMPGIHCYWETNSRLFSSYGVTDLFSKRRFIDIFSSLCLRDPFLNNNNPNDKLFKIFPFVVSIISQSQYHYIPERDLTIDESMVPFSGRHKLVQFMPLKPIRYGFKAFLLCEAASGYVLRWKLYTGELKDPNYGSTYRIVREMCEQIEGEGHILYMDRYYSGLQIVTDLKRLGIGACGTLQINRAQLTESLKKQIESLKDRETLYLKSENGLLLSCWKDSRIVVVISNFHGVEQSLVTRNLRKKDKQKLEKEIEQKKKNNKTNSGLTFKEEVNIPISIKDYNNNMAGVDLFDQKASYYGIQLSSRRWYMKIFFHFLEIAVINSYIIYTKICQDKDKKPMSHLLFRKEIIRELVYDLRESLKVPSTEKKKSNKRKSEEVLKIENFSSCKLEKIPPQPDRVSTRYYCSLHQDERNQNNKRSPQTRFWCVCCKIPLCRKVCFDKHCKGMK